MDIVEKLEKILEIVAIPIRLCLYILYFKLGVLTHDCTVLIRE